MDQTLHARIKLDAASDLVLIDVRGSLTQGSRPSLVEIIRRVRRMGITSRIRVDLGRAAFVESSALAGLRNDLNVAGGPPTAGLRLENRVFLELTPQMEDPAVVLESLDLSTGFAASLDTSGTGPLAGYSDEELFAASDSVFGLLDNPALTHPELLATYDEIGLEINRRNGGGGTKPAW